MTGEPEPKKVPIRRVAHEHAGAEEEGSTREPGAASQPPARPHEADTDESPQGFQVRDRRWWAQSEEAEARSEEPERPSHVARLEAEIERLGKLVEDKDRLARETAMRVRQAEDELERAKERIRKDSARELEQRRRDVIATFLEVLDDLDRALAAGRRAVGAEALAEGVELVRKRFLAKLAELGVAPMAAAGERFDPTRHEAVGVVPVHDPAQDGTILDVAREGYLIGDDVLRPAFVIVGKLVEAQA